MNGSTLGVRTSTGLQALLAILTFSELNLANLKESPNGARDLSKAFTAYEKRALGDRKAALNSCPSTEGTDPRDLVRQARKYVVDEMSWLVG